MASSSVNPSPEHQIKIAVTLDDGPHASITEDIAVAAERSGFRLTFFVVGNRVAPHAGIIRRVLAAGHEVGNHSWSHTDFTTFNDSELRDDVLRTNDAIRDCGGAPRLLRPPFGAITRLQRRWIEDELHVRVVLWTVDSEDWKLRNATGIRDHVATRIYPGAIVLAHDIHASTRDAMRILLPELASAGYSGVTVTELHRPES